MTPRARRGIIKTLATLGWIEAFLAPGLLTIGWLIASLWSLAIYVVAFAALLWLYLHLKKKEEQKKMADVAGS